MNKRLLLVTGNPGVGKTTILLKVVEALKAEGFRVGGMISRDVRTSGSRVGFEIMDLNEGRKGWLANVEQQQGPQVGKYRVNLNDLNSVGVEAIRKAIKSLDAVAIDEIGPMELFSQQFKEAVRQAVESKKLIICTIHWKIRDRFVENIRNREDAELHTVTYENREHLHERIVGQAVDFLSHADIQ